MSPKAHADPLGEQEPSRYVVGIDLGTTNSAICYVDTQRIPTQVAHFPVRQWTSWGEASARDTLPSFHYQGTAAEIAADALKLPWQRDALDYCVGTLARDEGTVKPTRLIASAKSWLCHTGVDRTAELLPWQGAPDVQRISPIEATARLLDHLRAAWDHEHPNDPLAEQEVIVTLPASFDEVARELTIQAARRAQLPRITLIEEPQAAFYAWVDRHADDWQSRIAPGQKILVCDIGGGTTDFTLIRVRAAEGDHAMQFHRVAVGEHLILGGDNLDLALARSIEKKLAEQAPLTPAQWDALVRAARRLKETLLGVDPPAEAVVNLPSSGSQLIGGAIQASVERSAVEKLLVHGFLPTCNLNETPQKRRSGFQEMGLPFAADAAITRYLAAFLHVHRTTGDARSDNNAERLDFDPARPDVVLLNGGFFASPVLRARLLEQLSAWFTPPGKTWTPIVLDNPRLDLAVAHGAAYYGMVRRGTGVAIVANLARSYYLGVADRQHAAELTSLAVCLVPGEARAGDEFELTDQEFELTISEPAEFPLFVSSTRLADPPGTLATIDLEQMSPLPPIRTVLHSTRKGESTTAKVHLWAKLTEIGSLEMACREVAGKRRWTLQFDVRSATQTDRTAHLLGSEREGFVDDELLDACRREIAAVFSADGAEKPAALMKNLAIALDRPKGDWPTSLLRRMWEMLHELAPGRRRSAAHEVRWLNLTGFALRPGYGYAVDDWRVAETWRLVAGKLAFASSHPESLVLWRRLAGGLSRGAQGAIAEPLVAVARQLQRRAQGGKASSGTTAMRPNETTEIWRLLGSLELLDVSLKIELGEIVVDLLTRRQFTGVRSALLWTLGRLGQREPVYGPLNTVAPVQVATAWADEVMQTAQGDPLESLVTMQLTRRTEDRHRDIDEAQREKVVMWLQRAGGAPHLVELVRRQGALEAAELDQVQGEALPPGLRLR